MGYQPDFVAIVIAIICIAIGIIFRMRYFWIKKEKKEQFVINDPDSVKKEGISYGIELEKPNGKNNGTVSGELLEGYYHPPRVIPSITLLYATQALTVFEISSTNKRNVTTFAAVIDGRKYYETQMVQRVPEMLKMFGLIKIRNLTAGMHKIRGCAVGQSKINNNKLKGPYSNLVQFEIPSSNDEEKSYILPQYMYLYDFRGNVSSINQFKNVMGKNLYHSSSRFGDVSLGGFTNDVQLNKFYGCISEVVGNTFDVTGFIRFVHAIGPTINNSMIWGNIRNVCRRISQNIQNEIDCKHMDDKEEEEKQKQREWQNKIKNSYVDEDIQQTMDEMKKMLSNTDKILNETVKQLFEAQLYFQPSDAQNDDEKKDNP